MVYVIKNFLKKVDKQVSGCSVVVSVLRVKMEPLWGHNITLSQLLFAAGEKRQIGDQELHVLML